MIRKGIKFGMLLQLAVGPMCLMVFKTSSSGGALKGLILVSAIALVDGFYITLAGCGAAAVLNIRRIKRLVKILGCVVLIFFGINTISGVFKYSLLPEIAILSGINVKSVFLQGILLTASNPLTIIFWSSIFSTKVIERGLNKRQLAGFGIGCVLSTVIFLSGVAVAGNVANVFLPQIVIGALNLLIGILLIVFGIRMIVKKENTIVK